MHRYRTHTCDELREGHIGKTVRVSGWRAQPRNPVPSYSSVSLRIISEIQQLEAMTTRGRSGIMVCVWTSTGEATQVAHR